GVLATAPSAFAAAPAAVSAHAEPGSLAVLPEGAELGGVGPKGFLTYAFTDDHFRVVAWTPFDGGPRIPLGEPVGWDIGAGNVLVLGNDGWTAEMSEVTLRDMADPSAPSVSLNLDGHSNGTYVTVLSPNSVLAQFRNADGTTELHVVAKNGTEMTSRRIEGLPADATDFIGSDVQDGTVLVGYETGPAGARTGGRAVVDVAAGAVTETYDSVESGYGFSELHLSGSHVAWLDYDSASGLYVTSVGRGTKERRKTVLGARDGESYAALLGAWLVHGDPTKPVTAVNLTTGETRELAPRGTYASSAGDGTVVLRGETAADGKGLFRIEEAEDGALALTQVAGPERVDPADPVFGPVEFPHDPVDLDKTDGRVEMAWNLSRRDAYIDVRLTHRSTGRSWSGRVDAPATGTRFSLTWNAVAWDADAPNGDYDVEATARRTDGTGKSALSRNALRITRAANPHDFTDNGSTDVLARDASGVLWRHDLWDRPVDGVTKPSERVEIGGGWNTYKHIESVGDLGGLPHGDLVAVDGSGMLWTYLGLGDGTFTRRAQVGGGWQIYDKITGGSDLNADGHADLVATDTSGVLWFYAGTNDPVKPYKPRVKVGGGWQTYNQITAVGNIAGGDGGDLVARDKDGVLWLYLGKEDGTFTTRRQIGGGWQKFSQLVGAGDVDNDGRPDLIAYGAGGTYVYRSTGSLTTPFTRTATSLYAGEGTKFTSVS
ncbi:FG-GAP repeat domain-containing protein, partial [Streptomyces hydrogenans]|uniref:FG-GAP repeat domain-containing protein n=1 Tax=Streptomyces hydrogenans TaxID=1873719 RepID=UPI0036966A77